MNTELKRFGNLIKEKRMHAGLTQLDIAKKCGYTSAQFISNVETGKCKPTARLLKVSAKETKLSKTQAIESYLSVVEWELKKRLGVR